MFITKLKKIINKDNLLKKRIYMSGDFETIIINNIHYVYAIGYMYKDSNNLNIYKDMYININTENIELESKLLMKNFINNLLSFKKKIIIYFHNLSGFDSYFIVNCINTYFKEDKKDIIIRNNKIYKIKLLNIIFLDTYLIIPKSLEYISQKWLKKKKDNFDVTKVKNIIDIEMYWVEISKYLSKDVSLLFDIVNIIVNRFFDIFNIDIVEYFTISSISLAYYRKNYLLEEHEIEINTDYKYKFIRLGYYGGLCNLHKTISKEKIYHYDVNSLYPYIMKTCAMPLGESNFIIFSNNNYKTDINEYFGFISCFIYIPEDIKIPPLPFKNYKSKSETISQCVGYIKGIWFSEELKNAIKLGCKIIKLYKVLNYKKKDIIFNKYVDDLYNKKINSDNPIDNTLYKTIMNSLYGRFGLRKNKSISKWFPNEEFLKNFEYYTTTLKEYGDKNEIINYELDKQLYQFFKDSKNLSEKKKQEIEINYIKEYMKQKNSLISVQISAAISSYARIKLINDIYEHISTTNATIYYYDTDSIFTNIPINNTKISLNEIGKYKCVNVADKALFIAPKIYYLSTNKKVIKKFKTVKSKTTNYLTYDDYFMFLKKDYIYKIITDIPIRKNLKYFTILCSKVKQQIKFESDKYIKQYDENNYFIEAKPIKYEKEYWID